MLDTDICNSLQSQSRSVMGTDIRDEGCVVVYVEGI